MYTDFKTRRSWKASTCSAEATLVPTDPVCPWGSSMFRSNLNIPNTLKWNSFAYIILYNTVENVPQLNYFLILLLNYYLRLQLLLQLKLCLFYHVIRLGTKKKVKFYPASSAISCSNDSTWFWNTYQIYSERVCLQSTLSGKKNNQSSEMYLWCWERSGAAHGIFHLGCLNIQSFELVLKFVHERRDLREQIRKWF